MCVVVMLREPGGRGSVGREKKGRADCAARAAEPWPLFSRSQPRVRRLEWIPPGGGRRAGTLAHDRSLTPRVSIAADGWPARPRLQAPIPPRVGPCFQEEVQLSEPTEQDIRERAHRLWEQAGKPEGREEEFWRAAEQELRNEDKSNTLRTPDTL